MWNCTHFRHPTDEQLGHVDIFFSNYYNLQSVYFEFELKCVIVPLPIPFFLPLSNFYFFFNYFICRNSRGFVTPTLHIAWSCLYCFSQLNLTKSEILIVDLHIHKNFLKKWSQFCNSNIFLVSFKRTQSNFFDCF